LWGTAWWRTQSQSNQSQHRDSLLTGKITGKLRDLVRFRASRNKKTPAPQRFLEKCRENPAGKIWTDNREDIGQNRENAGIL
jgi:hypothetical protein